MAILETIMQLKQEGRTESEILNSLKQEGFSPKEINEAISQSKIKSALNEQDVIMQQSPQPPQLPPPAQPLQSTSEISPPTETPQMQPSMMQTSEIPQTPEQQFTQPNQPMPMQEIPPSFQPSTIPIPTTQMPAPQPEAYPTYQEYQYPKYQPQEADIETINEIASQIVDEKTTQLKKQIASFTKFREEIAVEVEKLNERLLKIEGTLNEFQTAILGKIGDYGKDIQNIAKEMHVTQDSFSKILNPLTDNIRELQKITRGETKPSRPRPKTKSKSEKKKKQKPSFEDYLR